MYDELVKALRGCVLSKPCDGCPYYDPNGPTEKCATMNIAAADAIEELICEVADEHNARLDAENRLRWIPVTERLPDERDSVLALTGDCDFYVCDYIPSVKQFWTIPGDELHIDDITHWMPLPEPPKEE